MEYLKLTEDNAVAYVVLNRPPANALASHVLRDLGTMLDELEKKETVRVIVLHGEGRFFSAGADIKEFTTFSVGSEFSSMAKQGQDLFERIETFSKPIIAAIHGAALGGGLELAMSCHLRYVTANAKLGLPELQLGLVPGFGGTQRLTKHVGAAKAAEIMFTSEPISGTEAVQWGLANQSFSEETLLTEVKAIAEKIASKSPLVLKSTIKLVNYAKSNQFYEGISQEAEEFGQLFSSEDAKEGIAAFIEKRPAVFKGK